MILETRFDLGQKVWPLCRDSETVRLPCKFCRGSGGMVVRSPSGDDSATVMCPRCKGAGAARFANVPEWKVGSTLTVGQVCVEVTSSPGLPDHDRVRFDNYAPQSGDEERYMCVETGIGSGTLHKRDALFASLDEAIVEVTRRNEAIRSGLDWKPSPEEFAAARGFLDHRDCYEHDESHVETANAVVAAFAYEPDPEDA